MSEPAHDPVSQPDVESSATATAAEDLLAALADDFTARLRRGEQPQVEEYAARHPELAERIRKVFQAVALMEQSRTSDYPGATESVGAIVGRYKLLERIGEGGFGVVYMAEQQQPIRRKVALKVVKPGMDSRQVLARFEAERQALAIMDHPNIAKVLDAGTTASEKGDGSLLSEAPFGPFRQKTPVPFFGGRPYFVMELVKGEPITEFCDRSQLSPRERLALFAQVCHAVQHAHQKGIIHRDIKPTNVLVMMHDTKPVVKVIDFGVAKALGQELTDKTLFTGFAQFLGTPLYMSPEQAGQSSLDVDTRSDIYSLGVLLYELLTGTTPFDKERFKKAAQDEIFRIIREEDPPRPSTRLSESKDSLPSISAQRQTEPAKLTKLVRGELDWIVMKALEKDRTRRYETATGMARDIERYLNDEPVEACPPSAPYRFRKFAQRNKGALGAGLAIAGLLVLGTAISTWQAIRATRAEAAAEANFQRARQAVDDMYTQVAEKWLAHQPQMEPLQREFLEKALRFYSEFAKASGSDPGVRFETARASGRVADIQDRLGESGQAEKAYLAAIDQLEELVADFPNVPEYRQHLAAVLNKLGELYNDTGGRKEEAAKVHRRALAIQEQLHAEFPAVVEYRRDLARGHWHLNKAFNAFEDDASSFHRALDIQQKLADEFPKEAIYREHLAETHLDLGTKLIFGQAEDHDPHLRAAVEIFEELSAEFPATPSYRNQLASAYWWHTCSRWLPTAESRKSLRRALAIQEQLVAEFPAVTDYRYDLMRSVFDLALESMLLDRPHEAEEAYRRAITIGEKLVADAPGVDYYQSRLIKVYTETAQFYENAGRHIEAESTHRRAIEHVRVFTVRFPERRATEEVVSAYREFAEFLATTGHAEEAEANARELVKFHPKDYRCYATLGMVLQQSGKVDEAELAWDRVFKVTSADKWARNLATTVDHTRRKPKLALELATRNIKRSPTDGRFWNTLGLARYSAGDWQGAIEALERSMELRTGGDSADWFYLAMAEWRLGNKAAAREWYAKAVEWTEKNAAEGEELFHFRTEAADLMGMDDSFQSAPPSVPSR